MLEIRGLNLSKRWVISYQASRSCRPLVITASSSGTEDQLGRGHPEMVHTKTHQATSPLTDKSFDRNWKELHDAAVNSHMGGEVEHPA